MNVKLHRLSEHLYDEDFHTGSSKLDQIDYQIDFEKKHRGNTVAHPCVNIKKREGSDDTYRVSTNYFVGVDWLDVGKTAVCVSPKLNNDRQVDYVKMLFNALTYAEIDNETNDLYSVEWNAPFIEIDQKLDLLTPFLVVEYLGLLKKIVRKGLKRSYYKVERNLHSKIKGKVLVGQTIKKNVIQRKNQHTYCRFDEFGVNNKENQLLKKALTFTQRYLPGYITFSKHYDLQNTFNYINPAFINVHEDIESHEMKNLKPNNFYKEYEQAIKLAKLILRRFGYNISNVGNQKIKSPPFWIDMSKLFEFYVLGLLKERFQKRVKFQYSTYGNELDYLVNSEDYKMVVDSKYKTKYIYGKHHEDIRQISGYARLRKVYEELGKHQGEVIDCLIVYPDQNNGFTHFRDVDFKMRTIPSYYDIYKIPVKLPWINI